MDGFDFFLALLGTFIPKVKIQYTMQFFTPSDLVEPFLRCIVSEISSRRFFRSETASEIAEVSQRISDEGTNEPKEQSTFVE